MSVNSRFGINPEKTQKFGKLFHTIDFDVHSASKSVLEQRQMDTFAGNFIIGGKEFKVTLEELDRIIETCQTAKTVFLQKYRFRM